MPCESCAVQFSMFKRKRACCECERYYCSSCLRRGGGAMCMPCRVLSTRPLTRQAIAHLKVRDLQCFLQRQNVSTRGCVEKEELLSLCVSHVNSAAYRRRGARGGAGAFSSLKGLTSNINDFINSTFDIRYNAQPAPPPPSRGCPSGCFNSAHVHESAGSDVPLNCPPRSCADRFTTALGNCFNSSHVHESAGNNDQPNSRPWPYSERFTTTPGGETDIRVPVPESSSSESRSASGASGASGGSARRDTADCFEIEDLDDTGWEFVNRPADPLPNDSDVLLSTSGSMPRRAASELDVRRDRDDDSDSDRDRDRDRDQDREPGGQRPRDQDSASLHDAPLMDREPEHHGNGTSKEISLERFKRPSELDTLNVKQLKELLTRNRVEYRGCLERKDLLERAKTLWRNHAQYNDDIDNLPSEECCKICMAAPLECVLLECGHIAACTACARQLAECPICRQYVVRAVRFFRS